MADITPARTVLPDAGYAKAYIWENVTENDTALPVREPHLSDKTVQVVGTFGGATVELNGTVDLRNGGQNFVQLTNPNNLVLTFAAAGIASVQENVVLLQPKIVGGTGVNIDIILLVR